MKNYFNFQLTGRQLLPLWIIFYLLFLVPYFSVIYRMQALSHDATPQVPPLWFFLVIFILILFVLIWSLYFVKIIVQSVSLKETAVRCDYNPGKYLGVVFLGLFLSIITLGIYSPWFMRNMQRFYVDNSSYKEKNFSFQGKGGKLLLIILLSVIIPLIFLALAMISIMGIDMKSHSASSQVWYQVVIYIILIPYMYYIYKWVVDIKYKEYHIKWETRFFPSVAKIALEIILSMITFGIYMPLAFLRLYKYFSERTRSNFVDNQGVKFGYDIDQLNDFLFIWGQTLLTIITLGIYYPWALCKIAGRIMGKSYMEKITE